MAGCDINAEDAWNITKGSSAIKVAVIDEGVQLTHPDLDANILPGFDAISNTTGATAGSPLGTNAAHGTNCAGIIAAEADNGIGGSGVAPLCRIIPVNIAQASGTFGSSTQLALGIDWAWQTGGADVLSNSWGGGSPSSLVRDAIVRATTLGRSRKGCVVVFSSGNSDGPVASPAIFDETIAVGAINMHNQRKAFNSSDGENFWGSNHGRRLDVVAPGVKIASTDITGTAGYSTGDYYNTFNGTSAAAPHVSGIAALVLSQYPTLTGQQVREVIEHSCTKVPGYSYADERDHANGKWNAETGYGMVNALKALQLGGTLNYCITPQIDAAGETHVCSGQAVTLNLLNPVPGTNYQWQKDGSNAGTGNSIHASAPGEYKVIGTNAAACVATSVSIKITNGSSLGALVANAGPDTSVCPGTSVLIGGAPSAKNGTPFIKRQRAYGYEFVTNAFVRFNPARSDNEYTTIKTPYLNATDNTAGNFTSGGDFTPTGYYAIKRNTNQLVRIDTATGDMTTIGVANVSGAAVNGMCYDSTTGNMYLIVSVTGGNRLYTINLTNAQTTLIGSNSTGVGIWVVADRAGQLYMLSLGDDKIYKLSKTTAAATALPAGIGADANFAQDADIDPLTDSLWLSCYQKASGSASTAPYAHGLRLANKTTGTTTVIGDIGNPLNEVDALAIGGHTYRYQWSPATNLSNAQDANPFFTSATPGTYNYTLTVTDMCGNTATDQVTITVHPVPVKPIISYIDTFLNHKRGFADTLRTVQAGGHTYNWLQSGSPLGETGNFIVVDRPGLQPIPVSVEVKNTATGCTNVSDVVRMQYGDGIRLSNNNDEMICDSNFYDFGGPLGNYAGSFTKVFRPSSPNKKIRLTFYGLNLGANHLLTVHDGVGTAGTPEAARLNSSFNNPAAPISITASSPDGALTVRFNISTSGPGTTGGWLAGVLCTDGRIYRSISNGIYSNKAIWESKPVGASDNAYTPAQLAPGKGDDTIYIRHDVGINNEQYADQVVITASGVLEVQAGGVLYIHKTVPANEIEVNGILRVTNGRFILGTGANQGVILNKSIIENFGGISCDSVVTGGNGPVIFRGVSNATISKLRVDNAAGATVDGVLRLGNSSGGGLALANGVLKTTNSTSFVQLNNNAVIEGGSAASYVDGRLRREVSGTSGPVTTLYPVGNASLYRPVELITNHQSSDESSNVTYEVEMRKAAAPTRTLPATLAEVKGQYHHKASIVAGSNKFVDARMRIYYDAGDGVLDPASLRVAKDDGSTSWTDLGGTGSAVNSGFITSNVFTTFSDFVLANAVGGQNTLPVMLLSFSGKKVAQTVQLHWVTSSEKNTKWFEVERSTNGSAFTKIAALPATGGISMQQQYEAADALLPAGQPVLYYRLKIMDADGRFTYSSLVAVRLDGKTGSWMQAYPNPFANQLVLLVQASASEKLAITISDAAGKTVLAESRSVNGGISNIYINTTILPAGTYQLKVTGRQQSFTQKLMRF